MQHTLEKTLSPRPIPLPESKITLLNAGDGFYFHSQCIYFNSVFIHVLLFFNDDGGVKKNAVKRAEFEKKFETRVTKSECFLRNYSKFFRDTFRYIHKTPQRRILLVNHFMSSC